MSDEKNNELNEPAGQYNRIRFFKSFEEADDADAAEMAALSPVQHLQNATELIKRIYAKELKEHPTLGDRIYFSE